MPDRRIVDYGVTSRESSLHRILFRAGPSLLLGALMLTAFVTGQSDWKGAEFYVSPSGRPHGIGTIYDPWDLKTALTHPKAVAPGDTIWLLEGVYYGVFESTLRGEPGRPILIRQFPGQRVTIDTGLAGSGAGLTVLGSDCWFWGIDIESSNPNRVSSEKGPEPHDLNRVPAVLVLAPRTKFINMVIHDAASGYGFWTQAENSEIYGNLIFHNGWDAPDRGHGHGIYAQNRYGKKRIEDNIAFSNFGMGIRAYGSENAFANHIEFVGNVSFNAG